MIDDRDQSAALNEVGLMLYCLQKACGGDSLKTVLDVSACGDGGSTFGQMHNCGVDFNRLTAE